MAVLPFRAIDPKAGEPVEAACRGMTDTLIAQLNSVKGFTVRSSPAPAGREWNELGRELQIDWLIEGVVQPAGERMRVTVRIVDARDGSQRWSRIFEQDAASGFALQDQISRHVTSAMQFEMGASR